MNDVARGQLAAGIETWANRGWLVLPGPIDMSGELVEHLAKQFAGWLPPARVITTVEELDALPMGSVVQMTDHMRRVFACAGPGRWWVAGPIRSEIPSSEVLDGGSVALLHTPENGDTE